MIPATWQKATIGELCQMVKGKAPIMKTKPGAYPLVTMGEEHKTADHYQLDGEAVCVPMISSFGHGKPGLKRVHYVQGKFAVSNLLTALVVKDRSRLSTRYLALYLNTFKDQLIVPLQTGAANMSLRPEKLAGVPVHYPSPEEQERLVRLLDEAETLRRLRARADERAAELIPAIFHELFGDLARNERGWNKSKIGNFTTVKTGGTPSRAKPAFFNGQIPWVKTAEVISSIIYDTEEKISDEGLRSSNCEILPIDTILIAMYGQGLTRGRSAKLGIPATTNQACAAILPSSAVDSDYLWSYLKLSYYRLRALGRGGNQPNLNLSMIKEFEITLPPLPLQREFAARVASFDKLRTLQAQSQARLDALFDSMLARAFAEEL